MGGGGGGGGGGGWVGGASVVIAISFEAISFGQDKDRHRKSSVNNIDILQRQKWQRDNDLPGQKSFHHLEILQTEPLVV